MQHSRNANFSLADELKKITPLLPHQGPIKDFIHQNTLQVFIDKPFHEAVVKASKLYSAKPYMDLKYYRKKFACGEIAHDDVNEAVFEQFGSLTSDEREVIRHALFNFIEIIDEKTFAFLASKKKIASHLVTSAKERAEACAPRANASVSLRALLNERLGCQIDHEVNAIFFRLVGAYIDQGVILWPLLEEGPDFRTAVLHLAKHSSLPLAGFVDNHDFRSYLEDGWEKGSLRVLAQIFATPNLYADYVQESLLHHPGWSGMVNVVAHSPDSLARRRNISIEDFLLVKLALEWQFIRNTEREFTPITIDDKHAAQENLTGINASSQCSVAHWLLSCEAEFKTTIDDALLKKVNVVELQRIWHIALEKAYYKTIVEKFADQNAPVYPKGDKKFQAIFCIDDRTCSFRRHLEAESTEIETFGFPGFFGIEFYIKSHKKDLLEKMCPAPVTPKYMVMEQAIESTHKGNDKKLYEYASFITRHGANSIFFGFISAYTLGHLSAFRLLFSFLQPSVLLSSKRRAHEEDKTSLIFERTDDDAVEDGLYVGFTHEEMAQRVFVALRNMGLVKNFAPMVLAIAHGSSSVNNPHFAAYDCGACSGRPGGVNSRLFAAMANLKEVRALVKEKGITIPDDTMFVGGILDTCTDEVTFFDLEKLSERDRELMKEFSTHIAATQLKNAQERCRRFALVSPEISERNALKEVRHRARALFEPRPELGHATNALCVVGRRERTYRKNFDRRAFFQSYDPTIDESGQILAAIMTAVIPVCGGINLEYFFSRVDPAVYGCGTKLSHNVCSLIGVGNGLDDDLRTGLPIQMTEIHDPVRLLIVIEQTPQIIEKAVLGNPALAEWVRNDWLKIASLGLTDNQLSLYDYKQQTFAPMNSPRRHAC